MGEGSQIRGKGRKLEFGGEPALEHTDTESQCCTPEIYTILLINVPAINIIYTYKYRIIVLESKLDLSLRSALFKLCDLGQRHSLPELTSFLLK